MSAQNTTIHDLPVEILSRILSYATHSSPNDLVYYYGPNNDTTCYEAQAIRILELVCKDFQHLARDAHFSTNESSATVNFARIIPETFAENRFFYKNIRYLGFYADNTTMGMNERAKTRLMRRLIWDCTGLIRVRLYIEDMCDEAVAYYTIRLEETIGEVERYDWNRGRETRIRLETFE